MTAISPRRVALLCGRESSTHDAIFAYGERLATSLRAAAGVEAFLFRLDRPARWVSVDGQLPPTRVPRQFDACLLQYNPFAFGRWGVAPWLPVIWRRLHASGDTRTVITVHEAHLRPQDSGRTALSAYQRRQLRSLLRSTDVVVATCRERAEQIASLSEQVQVTEIPVGSNLDPVSDQSRRAGLRQQLLGDGSVAIIATFGNAHVSRPVAHVTAAIRAIAERVGTPLVLNLGASPPVIEAPQGVTVLTPGRLDEEELSLYLSCADLVLLPYVHGAVTNRTALMAALMLGRPVLSTLGSSTDARLVDPGLRLVPVEDICAYAEVAATLASDPAERDALARLGRELYLRKFSWNVLAEETLAALGWSVPDRLGPGNRR